MRALTLSLLAVLLSTPNALSRHAEAPVDPNAKAIKVFILTGQSNMEGKAKVSLMDYQVQQPETRDLFAHFQKKNEWAERSDVWIKFLNRHGPLTVGYGSPNCIGPELQFGWTMGDHFDEKVLIIKTAWGGKSLMVDFRPPSAGDPPAEMVAKMLENRRKKKPETTEEEVRAAFGHYYRLMIEDVQETTKNLKKYFPSYRGPRPELAGIVWFQGWNDMINAEYTAAYADNMACFIRDMRKDLDAPDLPFVIGQMGVDGKKSDGKKQVFKEAQAAPAKLKEFKGNVAVVETDQYWDMEADAVFRKGWKEHLDEWNKIGSDRPYHYLGSAKCHVRMGRAFAEAILELRGEGQ